MANTNSSYTSELTFYDYSFIIISVPIGVFVFSANVVLLFVVSKSKDLKDPTYTMIAYILSLECFGAIQYTLVYSSSAILQYSTLLSPKIFCKGMFYILCCVLTSSLSLLCGISYYRYKIVSTASQIRSKVKELTIIKRFALCTFIASCIIHIPVIFLSDGKGRYCDVAYIKGYEYLTLSYYATMAAITYILPLIIIIINYSRLIIKLKNYVTPASSQFNITRRMMQNNPILKMLIIVTSMFMISSALFHSTLLFLSANTATFASLFTTNSTLHMILSLGMPVGYINNILNPIMYIVYDKNIREAVKLKFGRKKININVTSLNQRVTDTLSPTSNN